MDPVAPTLAGQPASNFTRPSDPSKYIRTYAKDVAQITNTPVPEPQPARPVPAEEKRTSTEEGVTVTEYDASPVNRKGDPASPKEYKQEDVTISASDSEGVFGAAPSAATVPLMPQGSINVQPLPSVPAAGTDDADAEREAVLARLREKLAGRQPEEAPASPEIPLRTAAPIFTAAPVSPPVPEPPSPPPPPSAPAIPAGPSPLHTYSSDFADRIDQQKSSTFSVLAAQSDAGQTPRASVAKPRKTVAPLIAGLAMLVIGIGAVLGAYVFTHRTGSVPTAARIPSLISYDEAVEVRGSGQELMRAVAHVAEGGDVSGNVIVTYLAGTTATSTTGIPQPGGVLIRNLSLNAPDILLRNIDDTSTVGVIRAGSETRPFIVLHVSSYERTFAGMLAWEPAMASDLAAFYPPYASLPTQASSTASSSSPQLLPAAPQGFSDAVVANHDVRVLRDASGRSLMLYGYRGKDMLIIARDEAAFSALVSRLSATGE